MIDTKGLVQKHMVDNQVWCISRPQIDHSLCAGIVQACRLKASESVLPIVNFLLLLHDSLLAKLLKAVFSDEVMADCAMVKTNLSDLGSPQDLYVRNVGVPKCFRLNEEDQRRFTN